MDINQTLHITRYASYGFWVGVALGLFSLFKLIKSKKSKLWLAVLIASIIFTIGLAIIMIGSATLFNLPQP